MSWVSKWVENSGVYGGTTKDILQPVVWGLQGLFGGPDGSPKTSGGPEGTGVDAYQDYLDWLKSEQERQSGLEGRELQTSQAVAEYRRNQIADRTGYAGLVTVRGGEGPDAVLRSDETAATDTEASTYDYLIAKERQNETESLRVLSGEQYMAEDKFGDLKTRFMASDDINDWRAFQQEASLLEKKFGWWRDSGGRKMTDFIQEYIDARGGTPAQPIDPGVGTPPGTTPPPVPPSGINPDVPADQNYQEIYTAFMASNDENEWVKFREKAVEHDKFYGVDSGLSALIDEYLAQRGITIKPPIKFPKGFPGQG